MMDEMLKKTMRISWPPGCNSSRPELPADFLFQVFVRLPIKQLFKCMLVSKFWCSIIRQPTFIQAYCRRNPISLLFFIAQHNFKGSNNNMYEVFVRQNLYCSNVVPCDHGQQEFFNLFNFSKFDKKQRFCIPGLRGVTQIINEFFCVYICNRVLLVNVFTGQVTDLPCPPICPEALPDYYFGFEPITGLYKLLCIDYSNYGHIWEQWLPPEGTLLDLYILAISGIDQEFSWRRLPLVEEDYLFPVVPQSSISVNGTLYWIYRSGDSICSFDLTREKFFNLSDANVKFILRGEEDICRKPCLVQFRGKVSVFYCKGRDMIIHSLETDKSWTVLEATLPDEFQNPSLIRVGSLSTGHILLANPEIENSITHVYAYHNKFERFFFGKFPQSVSFCYLNDLCCVEQNFEMLEALIRYFSHRY